MAMPNRTYDYAHDFGQEFNNAPRRPVRRKKSKYKARAKMFLYIIIAFAVGFLVVSRFNQVSDTRRELQAAIVERDETHALNHHLQSQIDRSVDLDVVRQRAVEEFGMRPIETHQLFRVDISAPNFGERIHRGQPESGATILHGAPGILINAIETLR